MRTDRMRTRAILAMAVVAAVTAGAGSGAAADDADLTNAATLQALDAAKASLEQAPKVGDAVKRIGVAKLEGEPGNVTDLVKTMLSKTKYDVVLTADADWAPLLDEFARQVKREDILIEETANELRVQGVDAVLYGTVEKSVVESVEEGGQRGRRATVRLLLSLASLSEQNPGSVLWSEQVTGIEDGLEPMSMDEKAIAMTRKNRLTLMVVGGGIAALLFLILAVWIVHRGRTPR